jgi:hypothetical protein
MTQLEKVKIYKKYFETASDKEPLVMHRGYALALITLVKQQQKEIEKLKNPPIWKNDGEL